MYKCSVYFAEFCFIMNFKTKASKTVILQDKKTGKKKDAIGQK